MVSNKSQTPNRFFGKSRIVKPISGHQCVLGMTGRQAAIVRDRALTTGVVLGLTAGYQGAFPGLDAWSPPI